MRSIVRWSVSFRLLVIPMAAALALFGALEVRDTPVDVLPEIKPPYVEIQTEALGLSATEVEQLITVPLERDLLNGVAGIDVIRSESVLGVSSITLVFEPGTDLLSARQLVQERLIQAHILPNVAKPPTMLQPLSSRSRVAMIGISSEDLSLTELGVLARWTIRPRLLGIPGVANVVIWGQREHQLQVRVDPERLRRNRVSLQQVIRTAGNAQLVSPLSFLEASTPGTGGFIDTPNQRLQVRHILPIARPAGLAQVPVDGNGGQLVLGDVADVVEDHQPLIGDAVVDGGPGLMLVVEKFPGANTVEVSRDVEQALDAMRPGLSGVTIDPSVFRPAGFIESAIDNIILALLVGGLLLALALGAVFLSWRPVAVSLVAIALSLVAGALVFSLLGETMNALALAGFVLAIGIMVDDAVVGVESTWRRASSVVDATVEARRPLAFGVVVIVAATLPVFLLDGTVGAFFEPLVLAYVLSVLASTAVALTVTPALSQLLLAAGETKHLEHALLHRVSRRYAAALSELVRRPRPALIGAGAVGLVALALTPLLSSSLVPSFSERELVVHLHGPPGTSRPEMTRISTRVGEELRSIRGVRNVGAHVGRAVMGDQIASINSGELWVTLEDDADYDATVDRIRAVVDEYPGLDRELVTYSRDRIRAVGAIEDGNAERAGDDLASLSGEGKPLVVRVYGKELGVLRAKANEVRELIADVEGVVEPRVEAQETEPTVEIEPNLTAARRHGIKPGEIRRAAATLVQGIEVGSLFEQQKVFDVVVVGVPRTRHSLTSLREQLIDKPGGDQVRLSEVADVRIAATPTVIAREAASRRIDIVADVRGRDLGDVISDVETGLKQVKFPLEYHAAVRNESTERESAGLRNLTYALAAGIAILLLLQAALGSWRLAFLFFVTLPIALAGGLVVAAIGGELTLGEVAGLLTVLGLAVRGGLLLVDRYRNLQRENEERLGANLVVRGAQDRLRPIVAGTVATAAALLPFLVPGDIAGFEIVRPLAMVVLGGLVTTTLFTLFVVPAVYLLAGPRDGLQAEEALT